MASSGVESVRAAFYWHEIQPNGPDELNFTDTDAITLAAARRGLGVLPVVHHTPTWAALNPGDPSSPPKNPDDFARILTALVTRYGPNGSLWAEHPEVTRQPIRSWQVWNEPNLTRYWNRAPWAPSYVALLKRPHRALKAADPGSTTVMAGLPNESWKAIKALYDAGRARRVRRRRAAPVHGDPEERHPDREDRAARDGPAQGLEGPRLDHGALVAAAQGKTEQHGGFETTEKGQKDRLKEGPAADRRRAPQAADRARLLVHVAVRRGHHRQRLRLLGAAPDARRAVARRAVAVDVHAPGTSLAGLREAAWPSSSLPLTRSSFLAPCRDETVTGLSFRNGRSGACCWRRWRAASASSCSRWG